MDIEQWRSVFGSFGEAGHKICGQNQTLEHHRLGRDETQAAEADYDGIRRYLETECFGGGCWTTPEMEHPGSRLDETTVSRVQTEILKEKAQRLRGAAGHDRADAATAGDEAFTDEIGKSVPDGADRDAELGRECCLRGKHTALGIGTGQDPLRNLLFYVLIKRHGAIDSHISGVNIHI